MYLAMNDEFSSPSTVAARPIFSRLSPLRQEIATMIRKCSSVANVFDSDYSRVLDFVDCKRTAYYRSLTHLVKLNFMIEIPSYMNRATSYYLNPAFTTKLTSDCFQKEYLANYETYIGLQKLTMNTVGPINIPGHPTIQHKLKLMMMHFIGVANSKDIFTVEYNDVRDLLDICRSDFNLLVDHLEALGKIEPFESSSRFLNIEYKLIDSSS